MLLGVTDGGRMKVPPDTSKFNERERADWMMGVQLIEGCMATHETATCVHSIRHVNALLISVPCSGLAPEIAHFRTASDSAMVRGQAPSDWYIKGTTQ
jgi:hypothetical protein